MRILVALGGNALLKRGEPMTAEVQRANVRTAARSLAPVAAHHQLVLSHGNGPQVGLLALQAAAYTEVEPYPLDVLGAQTEGMIGYLIEQELGNLLPAEVPLATILTMVEVDPDDPGFADPTKFVGPIYDDAEAEALAAEKGWVFKRDGEHLRRVVPSPAPQRIFEIRPIRWLLDQGVARHLRRRRRHPDRLGAGRGAHARRRRGGDRQGPRQRAPGPRGRRRPVRDGHRRRRRLRRVGDAGAAPARPRHARRAAGAAVRRRVDGPEGRGRGAVRRGHRQAGRHRLARRHRADRGGPRRHDRGARGDDEEDVR